MSPLLQQTFYIGDGKTAGDVCQEFIAPAGATRLFLGIPDGLAFAGPPGAYADNVGAYSIRVGINQTPTPGDEVPEPGTVFLTLAGLGALAYRRSKS